MYSSKPDDGNLPEVVPFSAPEVALSNAPEVAPSSAPEILSPEDVKHARNLEESQVKYPVLADPTPLYYPVEKSDLPTGTVVSPLSPDGANALGGLDAALAGDGASTAPSPTLGRNEDAEAQDDDKEDETKKARTYCGLSKRNFIIIIVAAVLVVAALAGGLGGGLAASKRTTGNAGGGDADAANNSGSSSATTAPAITTTAPASASSTTSSLTTFSASSTTPVPTPTATTTIGDEDFSFDGWSAINYKDSETPTYKDTGFMDLPFNVTSYVWDRGSTVCCLTFCRGNNSAVGYRCEDREQPVASAYFDRIYVWCDEDVRDRSAMCSQ